MRGEGGRNLSALLKAECTPASLGFLDSSIVEFFNSVITVGCGEIWFSVIEPFHGLRKRQFHSDEEPMKSGNRKKKNYIHESNPVGLASLVVQWLRIHLPMQATWVRALVWEDPTCCGATKPVRRNY